MAAVATTGVVGPDEIAAAQASSAPEMEDYFTKTSLRLQWCKLPGNVQVLCDVSRAPAAPRPVVPSALVQRLLSGVHGVAHAGANATVRDISRRFV